MLYSEQHTTCFNDEMTVVVVSRLQGDAGIKWMGKLPVVEF